MAIYKIYWNVLSKKLKIAYIIYFLTAFISQAVGSLIQRAYFFLLKIIINRHYSNDIWIAWWMSFFMFWTVSDKTYNFIKLPEKNENKHINFEEIEISRSESRKQINYKN